LVERKKREGKKSRAAARAKKTEQGSGTKVHVFFALSNASQLGIATSSYVTAVYFKQLIRSR
jgi:hypothetical protein